MSNFTDYKLEDETPPRDKFRTYRRIQTAELRPYEPGEDMNQIDTNNREPKAGDMIRRDPGDPSKQWLVSAAEFIQNYEPF